MSIESRIDTALAYFGYPIKAGTYSGDDDKYFTFNIDTFGDDHGDNKPHHEKALIQVHLFLPTGLNSVATRKTVKLKLFDAGFGYPTMTDASDKISQHWVFEIEAMEGVDLS
jgi:hypothetical protein